MRVAWAVQGLLRDCLAPLRPLARRFRRWLSVLAYRLRNRAGKNPQPPRVVSTPLSAGSLAVPHPAVAIVASDIDEAHLRSFLAAQTETSVVLEREAAEHARYCLILDGDLSSLPATHLEALLMAAAAEDLQWVTAGWAAPAPGRWGPATTICSGAGAVAASHTLLRLPGAEDHQEPAVLGRTLAHIAAADDIAAGAQLRFPSCARSGPYLLHQDLGPGTVISSGVSSLLATLGRLPESPGPPTVLFLLSFLAVGGAEKLLFELV